MTSMNLGSFLTVVATCTLALTSQAQNTAAPSTDKPVTEPAQPAASANTTTGNLSNIGGTPSTMTPIAGVKFYNDSRRGREIKDVNGMRSKSRTEVFVGFKDVSGWGAYAQIVETAKNYGNADKNQLSPDDPSLSVSHPILYESGRIKLGGILSQSFPVSDFSTKYQVYKTAYSSILTAKLPKARDVVNSMTVRYFSQPSYAISHSRTFWEDRSTLTFNTASWLRTGIGQKTQIEWHPGINTGTTIEVFPYADFILGKTTYLSPRVYLPVYSNGDVYDAPRAVSTNEILAEVFFQSTL
jgi:hypothetical protein